MNNKTNLLLSAVAALLLAQGTQAATPALEFRYKSSTLDASRADAAEITGNLVPITPSNDNLVWSGDKSFVKVVTWKSASDYNNFIAPFLETSTNENFVVWVTAAPYIQNFCKNFIQTARNPTAEKLDLRLKKHLGLHPDWQYDVFVEMWVNPGNIIRPCVDPDPTDTTCDLNFGASIPTVKNIADYKQFYQNLYYKSFRAAPGVPWTGLGYTYDWKDPRASEVGESEFVLVPGTPYIIEQAIPTWQYCQP